MQILLTSINPSIVTFIDIELAESMIDLTLRKNRK